MNETNDSSGEAPEITIEKLVYGGEGLARRDRQVILTPRVLPGEQVRVEVVEAKPQLLKARPIELVAASAERRLAPCPYFDSCGGCHYQHTNYAYQLDQKLAILREVFERVGKFKAPDDIRVISGPEFGYRNRAQFHLADGKI